MSTPPPPAGPPAAGPPPAGPPSDGYSAPAGGAGLGNHTLAEWPKRFVATLIDQLLYLPGYIIYAIGMPKTWSVDAGDTQASGSDDGNIIFMLIGGIILLAVFIWNRVLKQGKTGQSVGKGVAKIRAINEQTGQPLGAGPAFLRDLISSILMSPACFCGIPGLVNYLSPLWDKKKQTWSDKATKTIVVMD